MNKKLLSIMAVLCVVLSLFMAVPTVSYAATEGVFKYTVENGEAKITGCDSSVSGDIIIPDTLGGYSVTRIGDSAFLGCANIESIDIPDGVTRIDYGAFMNCTSLKSIDIPNGVTRIAGGVFYNTKYYNTPENWENKVLYIGNHLVNVNEEISGNYTIKSGTLTIAGIAFMNCTKLESIDIPNGLISIGYRAFQGCESLESITIPDSVTSIGVDAFLSTKYYRTVGNLENGALYIGRHLIRAANLLENCSVKSGTLTIADGAFLDCTNLKNIDLPSGLIIIGERVFSGCESLENINIPSGVKSIDGYTFSNCTKLESITIPDSVTNIGWDAFQNCSSLKLVNLSNCLKSIGDCAFLNCKNLESIEIPGSVTRIGECAFSDCEALSDVYYTGSREQWNEISIGDYNMNLIHANIHYSPSINVFSAVKSGSKIKVNVEIFDIEESDSIFVATYGENNKFLGFKKVTLTDGEGTESLPYEGVLKLKGFLWNSKLSNIADCQQVFYK